MTEVTIQNRTVGPHRPVFVIAEIGVNHDGSRARALELIEAARQAGADAIKLQVFQADTLMHKSGRFADYQKRTCSENDPVQMLRRYELLPADQRAIVRRANALGLIALATPFSLPDVPRLVDLCLPAIKIASPDIINRPLLKAAAATGRPMILSTGAATMAEVDQCAQWLRQWHASFALLHCISSYPTPADQANLGWIGELTRRFAVPVGYSDHTTDLMTGALAVAAGACILEKHLTYDCAAEGPDHAASADPDMFAEYVRLARQAQSMMGRPGKCVLDIERDVRAVSRQSLVLLRDIPAGQAVEASDLGTQRPGAGISAADVERVVGLVAVQSMSAGTMLQWHMLDERREVSHAA